MVSAHDILNGDLSPFSTVSTNQQSIDVFRTTCFSWGDGVHDTLTGAGLVGAEVTGPAAGFRFAVNLHASHNLILGGAAIAPGVKATVGYTAGGNVDNYNCVTPGGTNSSPSNCLAYDPTTSAPVSQHSATTTTNAAWSLTGAEPDFTPSGNAPHHWSTATWLPGGNGEYVVVVQNISTTNGDTAEYDFVGHCQKASTGVTSTIHTGQGTWFTTTGSGLLTPTFDYDQVIAEGI